MQEFKKLVNDIENFDWSNEQLDAVKMIIERKKKELEQAQMVEVYGVRAGGCIVYHKTLLEAKTYILNEVNFADEYFGVSLGSCFIPVDELDDYIGKRHAVF